MPAKRPIAIFDIDGTIFRSSLLIELNARLVHERIFPQNAADKIIAARQRWMDRKGSYEDYIHLIIQVYARDIKGARVSDIQRVSRSVVAEQRNRVYVYTRDLIKQLRRTHSLCIISLSPAEAVAAFNKYYKFDIVAGLHYPRVNGRYTGGPSADQVDKQKILEQILAENPVTLRGSVGVGDTESDIGFLSMVDRPIAFNSNKVLYAHARKKKWEIVAERKDVIYKI